MTELKASTTLTELAFNEKRNNRMVNCPLYRTSTKIFADIEEFLKIEQQFGSTTYTYGRCNTPSTDALLEACKTLDSAKFGVLFNSGLSALSATMLAMLSNGDHILIGENLYLCTRRFIETELSRFGISYSYFNTTDIKDLKSKAQKNTKMILFESPGSYTFEVADIGKIVDFAKKNRIITALDNTCSSPLLSKPLDFGVDLAIQSLTKYYSGNSDVFCGFVGMNSKKLYNRLFNFYVNYGSPANPSDCDMILKGVRTLYIRLKQIGSSAEQIYKFLQKHPKVAEVLHPLNPKIHDHKAWKKYYKSHTGVMCIVLKNPDLKQVKKFIKRLKLFKIGLSWGGFESIVVPINLDQKRECMRSFDKKILIRISIGLGDPKDLIEDLNHALKSL